MDISHSNNNNNNNNNNMNENMNGRRIFKMIQDFAYNVAGNFGIYDDSPNEMEKKPRISEIASHVPIFGRPETVFDPKVHNSYLTTTTTPPVLTSRKTTASSTSTSTTASYSLFSNNYSNIRKVFKTKQFSVKLIYLILKIFLTANWIK